MNQTIGNTKIIWKKTPVYIEVGLKLAAVLATTMMLVSLMALAKVAQGDLTEELAAHKAIEIMHIDSKTNGPASSTPASTQN